jgi:hypothetical protein
MTWLMQTPLVIGSIPALTFYLVVSSGLLCRRQSQALRRRRYLQAVLSSAEHSR